jgi:hypothetical protein
LSKLSTNIEPIETAGLFTIPVISILQQSLANHLSLLVGVIVGVSVDAGVLVGVDAGVLVGVDAGVLVGVDAGVDVLVGVGVTQITEHDPPSSTTPELG